MLALHPQAVSLSQLPPKGEKLVGIMRSMAPHDATAEFGAELVEATVALLGDKLRELGI